MGDRVVLVRVALGTVQGESHPSRAHGGHPVLHRLGAILLGVATALVVDLGISIEASGDALGQGGLGQEITGQLIDGELVERLVAVEGLDHPLAVRPNGTGQIHLITVGIGITRQIEPPPGHVLPVVGRGEQAVDEVLKSAGRRVREKGADLGRFRGQASKIQGHAADQVGPIGFRLLLQPLLGQSGHDEPVDGILEGGRLGQVFWRLGPDGRLEGPMLLGIDLGPDSALPNPAREAGDLVRGQSWPLGRHDLVRIGGGDAADEFAVFGFSHHQGGLAGFGRLERRRPGIQTKIGLLLVRAMAFGAAPNQQRLDLGREVGGRHRPGNQEGSGEQGDRLGKQGNLHGLWYGISFWQPLFKSQTGKSP